jgi:Fe-S-cluster containining protein
MTENTAEVPSEGISVAIEVDYSQVSGKKAECPEGCGMCCLCQPEVLPEERSFFRTKYPKMMVKSRCADQHFALAMKKGRGSCVFLNGRKCDIYRNRTTYCRQFPYHFYVSDKIEVELDLSCRGVWTGKGSDAETEARELAQASERRLTTALKEASSVYREFYSICGDAGVMCDIPQLRASVTENLTNFTNLAYVTKVMDVSLEEAKMSLDKVTPDSKFNLEELTDAAREASLASMASDDPLNVPVYCDKDYNWNMFMVKDGKIEWSVMDDEGDLSQKGTVDVKDIPLIEPDESGKEVLAEYIKVLNGRDSFLGNVFYMMDEYGYEDDMANTYYGALCVTIVDLLWRASMLNHFFGTGMGAEGIREAIIFYDMDRLDAPTIGAFV